MLVSKFQGSTESSLYAKSSVFSDARLKSFQGNVCDIPKPCSSIKIIGMDYGYGSPDPYQCI